MTVLFNKDKSTAEQYDIEAKLNSNDQLEEYKKETKYMPEYVSAAQGKIYIDGILIDECYDIQYTHREFKEPVYGYNSKYFDTILPGTVIVQGAFTINYKHDAYLINSLKVAKSSGNNVSISSALKRRDTAKENQKKYKQKLITLSDLRKSKKEQIAEQKLAKTSFDEASASHTEILNEKTSQLDMYNKQLENKKKELSDFVESLTPEEAQEANDTIEEINDLKYFHEIETNSIRDSINGLKGQIAVINTIIDETVSLMSSANTLEEEADLNDEYNARMADREKLLEDIDALEVKLITNAEQYNNQLQYLTTKDENANKILGLKQEVAIAEMNKNTFTNDIAAREAASSANLEKVKKTYDDITAEVNDTNNQISDITKSIISLKGELDAVNKAISEYIESGNDYVNSERGKRAEDYSHFNIYVEYNGNIHKVINTCTITGHSHVLNHSGEPVKEYYTFIARDINQ
jgi:hypothetical protein